MRKTKQKENFLLKNYNPGFNFQSSTLSHATYLVFLQKVF